MKARIENINGKAVLKVFYDPVACNWNDAITAGLASYGLRHGQLVAVLAFPIGAKEDYSQTRKNFTQSLELVTEG